MATTGLFAIGESHIAFACAVLAMALLLPAASMPRLTRVWLILVAFIAIRSYESFLFYGPALTGLVFARWRTAANLDWGEKSTLVLSALLFGLATYVALESVLYPLDPDQLDHALQLNLFLRHPFPLVWVLYCGLAYAGLLCSRKAALSRVFVRFSPMIWLLLIVAMGLSWLALRPAQHYSARVPVSAVLLAFIVTGIVYRCGSSVSSRDNLPSLAGLLRRGAVAALVVWVLTDTAATLGWWNYLSDFRRSVNGTHGQIAWESTKMARSPYAWSWTNPSLSFVVRSHAEAAVIRNPNRTMWQPFDPA